MAISDYHNTADATAEITDVKKDETFYARGKKLTGTQEYSVSGTKFVSPTDWAVSGNKLVIPTSWTK